jgi:alkyldihydroxyacetonephosphate synthase
MPKEVGELGVELLRSAKERLDPAGIMNPGKLLPVREGAGAQ